MTDVLSGGSKRLAEHGRAAGLRDPWEASGESAQSHDPHEVTVQLDSVCLQQDQRLRKAEGETGGGPDSSDAPVFVDESGRRSRRFRRLGIAVGIACAVYAVVIVVTLLSGSSDAPWLPVPGQQDDKPAGQVEPTSRPADSAQPSGTGIGAVVPGSTPTAGDGTTPSPGASGTAHGKSTGPAGPGASADPGPTPSKSATKPGPGVVDPVPSTSVNPPTSSSPAPSPSVSSVAPSPSPGGTGGTGTGSGSGPVADGPSSPSPVTEEPGTPAASSAPSPEPTL
ncbi:hypothetical protein [Streptomyces sp. NBC_00183]|uniref:hypothetical protein n=1 Tax=unclassified Streptomyces TaxID=2593676 RepID=UPI0022544B1C|nr:hypothetical protein [Streptomyces sp. NBC_00183]MCX5287812.1 hypothetical protein [Streptomyces sp. NBC_00183]